MAKPKIRILMVEDMQAHANFATNLLNEAGEGWYELDHVGKLSDAIRRLRETAYDVVLLDLNLPDSNGVSTVSQVREASFRVPIVVLSGWEDESLEAQSLQQGAQEYLVKGWAGNKSELLVRAIRYAIERKKTEDRIQRMSRYDSLTNVANRSFLYDRLEVALARARRLNRIVAVLLLDLDHFKNINDTLGHTFGDRILKRVAERLTGSLRASDIVARMGGDEFAVLLPEIEQVGDVAQVADKIMAALRAPVMLDEQELFVSTSIGSSIYPDDGEDAETLLKNADSAVQRAKQIGRNNLQFYSPLMNAKASKRLQLGNALRRALEREEFLLHYQPQVDLEGGRIVGVEALVRWRHPGLGLVSPMEFIPLAEETGLILPIGEWVLREACRQTREWHDAGIPPFRVSVNLSNRQFNQKGLVDSITEALRETRLEPQHLALELTESGFMHNEEEAIATLHTLKEMGIRVSIDDFGTGYSSLRYLKRFPIDELKIDRSFVRDITTDHDDAAIVGAIIAMGNSLRLTVVAEGVETREQLDFLRAQGCSVIQGFYLSRPLPTGEMTRVFEEGGGWETDDPGSPPQDG
jgi:diguanylate cyclase (GGDEF)-like protein